MTKLYTLILIITICTITQSIKLLSTTVRNDGPKCFYLNLMANEKYYFSIQPEDHQKYRIDVMYQENGAYVQIMHRQNQYNNVARISKFAQKAGIYMFCISSFQDMVFKFKMEIMSGLQLKNFDYLPDKDDNQNLNREIEWIRSQKNKMYQLINRVDAVQRGSSVVNEMLSTKLIIFAILGLSGLIIINLVFFKQSRKVLKDRKLI